MKKFLFNSTLLIASALIAIALHVGLYTPPPGLIPDAYVTSTGDGSTQTVDLDAFEIVGVTGELELSDAAKVSTGIALLWENFFDDAELQSAIDWSQSNTVYAVYIPTKQQQNVTSLTIGLAPDELGRPVERKLIDVPAGQYQHFPLAGVDDDDVEATWQQIYAIAVAPRVVIERYALDNLGEVQQIQIQVLF